MLRFPLGELAASPRASAASLEGGGTCEPVPFLSFFASFVLEHFAFSFVFTSSFRLRISPNLSEFGGRRDSLPLYHDMEGRADCKLGG